MIAGRRREMHLWQLSIGGLLLLVLLCALGFALLRSQSDFWADFAFTAYLGALLFALPIACLARARVRRFALGFLLVGGGYAALAFGPWFDEEVKPHLATTRALLALHERVVPPDGEYGVSALSASLAGASPAKGANPTVAALQELRALAQQNYVLTRRLASSPSDPAVARARMQVDLLDGKILLASQGPGATGSNSAAITQLASLQLQRDSAKKQLENVLRLTRKDTDPTVRLARSRLADVDRQFTVLRTVTAGAIPPMPSVEQFVRTGHTLFGLLFALAGGVCALVVAAQREKQTNDDATPATPAQASGAFEDSQVS